MGPDALKAVEIQSPMFNLFYLEHLTIGDLIFNTFFSIVAQFHFAEN